jgi:hypothetical protein
MMIVSKNCVMEAYRGVEETLHPLLISALDKKEQLVFRGSSPQTP